MSLPDPITLGHVLMLLGALAALWAAWQLVGYLRHRGHGRGTPGYARGRDSRRFALLGLGAAAAFFAAGCLTPLCEVALT